MRISGSYPSFFWEMEDTAAILLAAKQREDDEKLYFRWCILDALGAEIPYDDFVAGLKPQEDRTAEDIIKSVERDYARAFAHGYSKMEGLNGII